MDALLLAAVAAEVGQWLPARVEGVFQPEPWDVVLELYPLQATPRRSRLLLLSADPHLARVHLTGRRRPSPTVPPPFCLLLRSRLGGARLVDVDQPGGERLLALRFDHEMGRFTLVAEVMGKHSNLILLDGQGRIVDAIKRIPAAMNRYRQILPSLPYSPPPPQAGKVDPFTASEEDLSFCLASAIAAGSAPLAEVVASTVLGFSLGSAEAACNLACLPPDAPAEEAGRTLAQAVLELIHAARQGRLLAQPGRDMRGRPTPMPGLAGRSVSDVCDEVYGALAEAQRLQAERQRLLQVIRAARGRVLRRLAKQEEELAACEAADDHRLRGELLLAHLASIPRSASEVQLPDFHDPDRLVSIPLDPRLPPAANAQQYFRRYQKARRARSLVEARLQASRSELAFLDESLRAAQQAEGWEDLEAVADDLKREGYLPAAERPSLRKAVPDPQQPLAFVSLDGWTILVGRSARSNDHLTMRLARPDDWWLHAKGIPGAHVVIRVPPAFRHQEAPPPATLHQAALLAAYYSAARQGSHVPVDWTRRRNVWKPHGARPGFVLYKGERTLEVTPDASLLPPRAQAGG